MELEKLLADLEKAASAQQAPAAKADDKPAVSKEIEALLTKEASADNAAKAFEEGEKLAKAILEKMAEEAIKEIQAQPAETKPESTGGSTTATAAPAEGTEKVAEAKSVEAKAEEKTADAKTADAAKEVEKTAEAVDNKEETKEEDMNKTAQDAGKELAAAIMEKLAAQENPGTASGPGKIKQDHDKMVAFDNQKVQRNPRNATVSAMFDQLVARAKSVSNPTGYDQMATGASAPHDGKDKAMGTPSIAPSPDVVEKHAAVGALIEAGLDWETAVDLVKSAAEELAQEEFSTVKMAAVTHLVTEEGFDFDTAVEAVNTAVSEVTEDAEGKSE
jgi:hypothetical protein